MQKEIEMKWLHDICRIVWFLMVAGLAAFIFWATDKIVGSHAFSGGLTLILLFAAYGAGAPGVPWRKSWLAMRHGRFRFLKSVERIFCLSVFAFIVFGTFFTFFVFSAIECQLPDRFEEVALYRPMISSRVLGRDGRVIGEFFLEKRIIVGWEEIPAHVRAAFVAAEDKRFYLHHGIDLIGITRAAYTNVKARKILQGGSTITQQVAKLLIVGREKSFMRKIREAILARKIEKTLPKNRILTIYLNHVYLGHGAYGVKAAAEVYFGKDLKDLTLAEAALIAGALKEPTASAPLNDFGRARERQLYVLREMVDSGVASAVEAEAARRESIVLISERDDFNWSVAPYFVEYVRKYIYRKYGRENLFGRGLEIRTTLDLSSQLAAEEAVRRGLEELSTRLGFSGPIGNVPEAERDKFLAFPRMHPVLANVELMPQQITLGQSYRALVLRRGGADISLGIGRETYKLDRQDVERVRRWETRKNSRLEIGDLISARVEEQTIGFGKRKRVTSVARLVETPTVQSALVALEAKTGEVRALVGGYDFHLSQFDRATQAFRQAGSSIKPFVYTAAVEHGKTEADIVLDAPVSVQTASGIWAPHNYKGEFEGAVTLRTALAKSLNTVSVRLALAIGVPEIINYMRKMGLERSVIPRHISISLGTPDVSPLEMTASFASFPVGGRRVRPVFITRVSDSGGRVLEETKSGIGEQVMSPETAYIMVDMMKGVVGHGTGRRAQEIGRPAAGKTGTSTDFRDAWFIGYTTEMVCGVWVGRDNFKPIGTDTTGGNTAAPIWVSFMKAAHPKTPVADFVPPPGIVFARFNRMSGLRASPGDAASVLAPFRRGTLPDKFLNGIK